MNKRDAGDLRDLGLAFLGRVARALSHEITNAFSVINEMAGLEWDILRDAAKGQPVDFLELETLCEKIRKHVRRGDTATRNLNWMAHSVDQVDSVVDVEDALRKIATVAEHWLRQRRAEFIVDVPDPGVAVKVRPFYFAFAVLSASELVTGTTGVQTISLECARKDDQLEVAISNGERDGGMPMDEEKLGILTSLMAEMGGALDLPLTVGTRAWRMVLRFPEYRQPK